MQQTIGFICFGEVNTPMDRLHTMHQAALADLQPLDMNIVDGGLVIDDPAYETADRAVRALQAQPLACLVVCVAGWIPTHAVIRVTDHFRHLPMLLWGLCGWRENGRIITTAPQAGTSALRPAMQALGYTFAYVYNVIGKAIPLEKISAFLRAGCTAASLRAARVGTMGYRDMLLYGTQFEGNSMRARLGVEVEPFEMLEMVQRTEQLDQAAIAEGVRYVTENWQIQKDIPQEVVVSGVRYALAIAQKVRERGWQAVTLIDVDGMKKLLGFPPAMVFMLLEHYCGVHTVPENDVMGAVTQIMLGYLTGQTIPYLEYYEFFEDSMLIGVPDFIPHAATDGETTMLPAAFGLLSTSLLNVSKAKTGFVTCARLIYLDGRYHMHFYTAEARTPPLWEEYGWDSPAPRLPSLAVYPQSCTVEEFAQKVSSQHVLLAYGDHSAALRSLCAILDIEVV